MARQDDLDVYVATFIEVFLDNFTEQYERMRDEWDYDPTMARQASFEFSSSVAHEDAEDAVASR